MTTFITEHTGLFNYLCVPRQVLELELNSTELHLYALLLDRARLSQQSPAWEDPQGRVFIFYPIVQLAADLNKAESTVKRGLNRLEELGLLYRKRQGACRANRLYVRIPAEAVASAPAAKVPPVSSCYAYAAPCEDPRGKAKEKEAFDRLLQQKRREREATFVEM